MQSGISEKERLGRISRLDYSVAWLAFVSQMDRNALMELVRQPENIGQIAVALAQNAFDAGWEARGLADLAIIDKTLAAKPF